MAVLMLVACSDDDPVPDVDGFTIDEFPIEVGNWWKYQVVDTVYTLENGPIEVTDTVTVTAAETLFVDCTGGDCPGTYIRFVFDDGETQWEANTIANGDTLTYEVLRFITTDIMAQFWTGFRWYFPLEVGKTWWPYPYMTDRISVVDRGYLELPDFEFGTAYLLHRDWTGLNAGGHSDIWVVPHVGIVKHYSWSYCTVCDPGPPSSTWTLIDWFGYYDPGERATDR